MDTLEEWMEPYKKYINIRLLFSAVYFLWWCLGTKLDGCESISMYWPELFRYLFLDYIVQIYT